MSKPTSTDPLDYDVLIRRQDQSGYAAYCPQLMYMIKGSAHEEVEEKLKEHILRYIESLKAAT